MPTASSAQMRKNINKIMPQRKIRVLIFFTFLRISLQDTTVTDSRIPIIAKSAILQSIPWVNCMAISGISNKIAITEKIRMTLLFFIFLSFKGYIFSESR